MEVVAGLEGEPVVIDVLCLFDQGIRLVMQAGMAVGQGQGELGHGAGFTIFHQFVGQGNIGREQGGEIHRDVSRYIVANRCWGRWNLRVTWRDTISRCVCGWA